MNEPFGGDIVVKVDLSDYVARADIKNISHVDKSNLASQSKNQLRQNITFTCLRKKKKKKSYKHLVQFILEIKVILKKEVHKIIQYFNQCIDILRVLLILIIF